MFRILMALLTIHLIEIGFIAELIAELMGSGWAMLMDYLGISYLVELIKGLF